MIKYYKDKIKNFSLDTIILLLVALFYVSLPSLLRHSWFSIIVLIREAIHSGDGAKLFLASAFLHFSYGLLSLTAYLLSFLFVKFYFSGQNDITKRALITIIYLMIRLVSFSLQIPVEPILDVITLLVIFILTKYARMSIKNISAELIIALQIFLAIQWLNTMPAMASFGFGQTELPVSIKISGAYLDNIFIQNMISIVFILPLLLSATMTSMRFRANNTMVAILEENIQKAKELKDAQSKIMENRVYKEVNSMAHDLKTPLVTIRGLNSMLMLSKDISKIGPYTERIDSAVEKMSELISSFLYGSHRQKLSTVELINYVRAQVPIDNDLVNFNFMTENEDTIICGNKIRLSRAIINIIENAIIATSNQDTRNVSVKCISLEKEILITIEDNGIGIDINHVDDLFTIGISGVGSTGLGLPFAKQIIEEHQGNISIDSELGYGTIVSITLPIYQSERSLYVK